MSKKALVTGCAGFIASHLTDALLTDGYRVIGIDNFRTGTMRNLETAMTNDRFTLIKEDITSSDLSELVSEDVDVIYHLAAIASVALSTKEPLTVNKTNVDGTVNVLELARQRNAKRFVFSSSAAVYGDPEVLPVTESTPLSPLSPYAASKIAGEYYVKAYAESFGLGYTILRFFNVYGPRQDDSEYSGVIAIFADRASKGLSLLIEGDGNQTRSFIYVDDVVFAVKASGESASALGQTINISGTESISILNLAGIIKDLENIGIEHVDPRLGDIRISYADSMKAESILELTSCVPLQEGLRNTLDWYRSRS